MEIYFPWHRALCWHQKILFFASATSQHFRIRHKPNSGIRRRIFVAQSFGLWHRALVVAQSLGFAAFKKAGKFYFLQSSQTKGRGVLAAFATRFCLRHCVFLCKGKKLQNSAFAEFSDCLPVSCFTNAVCQNCKKLRFLR